MVEGWGEVDDCWVGEGEEVGVVGCFDDGFVVVRDAGEGLAVIGVSVFRQSRSRCEARGANARGHATYSLCTMSECDPTSSAVPMVMAGDSTSAKE